MKYRVYDSDGVCVHYGPDISKVVDFINIPTHGSISLQLGSMWLNFQTSEWLVLSLTELPKTWEIE